MKKSLIALSVLAATSAFAGLGFGEQIPSAAMHYRATLTREAHAAWGLDAPVATFAAQVHQESRWRNEATSPVGAAGLAQVMPGTAAWLKHKFVRLTADVADSGLPGGDRTDTTAAPSFITGPTNPIWSLRALVTYDHWLWQQLSAADACQHMAKTLRSYNGGLGWIQRDQRLAVQRGINPAINFGSLDTVNAGRTAAAFAENVSYPKLILKRWEPAYIKAGFGPGACA